MAQDRSTATREKLIRAAIELIRRKGFVAARIDEVCELSGVSKGAFFHHFSTKEELAGECLAEWDRWASEMVSVAEFNKDKDPRRRVLGYMEFFEKLFADSGTLKSCLAGTTVQEVADTHPELRHAANVCFINAQARFKTLLDDACRAAPKPVDTASLAALWMAAVQGSLILFKASGDATVIAGNLGHVKAYISSLLPRGRARKQT